jgi:chromosome segregation ATPase
MARCLDVEGVGLLVDRLERERREARAAMVLSPSQVCERYHAQACHVCERAECGDNTSPAVVALRETRAELQALQERLDAVLEHAAEAQAERDGLAAYVSRLIREVDDESARAAAEARDELRPPAEALIEAALGATGSGRLREATAERLRSAARALRETLAERPATDRTRERLREALATIADRGCADGDADACATREPSRRCDACLAEAALADAREAPEYVPAEGADDDGGCGWGNAD